MSRTNNSTAFQRLLQRRSLKVSNKERYGFNSQKWMLTINVTFMNDRIAIIGAGDLGQQIFHLATKNGYQIVGFFDDYCNELIINEIPVLGGLKSIYKEANKYDSVVIAIGYKHMDIRCSLYAELKLHRVKFATIIDKTAMIDPTVKIGEGSVIATGVVLDKGVVVEENVFINLACCVAHDTIIGAHSFLAPRVAIAGFTHIGQFSFLGINSTIIDNLCLPSNLRLGAGAVVISNLKGAGLYIGVPAIKI